VNLIVDQLTKNFDRTPVLKGVSLAVAAGEFVAVVGPSGSGKSTLLYCMSGLEPATSGSVTVMGSRLETLSGNGLAALRRRHVGFVFQSYNLIPSLTARENVALPARLARRPMPASAADAALAAVGLAERASHRPSALSGGQQQRVAIARVIALRPDVVFADEPTGALDTESGDQVLDLLSATARDGRSVVMVTHDLAAAARADRVLVLRDGLLHRTLVRPSAADILAVLK
jgi:putative ABC transport system ATP-binding protein